MGKIKKANLVDRRSTVKADSHIACRAHVAPMTFPCHAVPLRVQNVSFPFDLHSAAVSDSYLLCQAHAAPMLFPCHAVPLRVQNVSFTFHLHTAAVSDSHLPCHAHATPMPCSDHAVLLKATARHGTAVERRPVGYLPTFGFFRLPCGVPRILLSEAYPSSSQRSIPTTVKTGSSTLQKR